jgi:hypothetical protein
MRVPDSSYVGQETMAGERTPILTQRHHHHQLSPRLSPDDQTPI